ncbi:MAG: hypothetical protein IJM81_09535 [Prevotella sp.]|nr:hypothetical protein [Prevotella sp.]
MRKILMTLAAVLCCAMTTTVFTACGSDDDDNTTKPDDTTPVGAVMDYSLETSDAMLATFDLTVEYYDANGKVQTEPMTQKTWTKKVSAKLPATLGARLKAQLKSGVDVSTQEKVSVAYGYNYMGYAVSATDKVVSDIVSHGTSTSLDMKGEKVSEWLERHADGLVKFLFVFDAKGQPTSSIWQ